jgi:hypothetical protein
MNDVTATVEPRNRRGALLALVGLGAVAAATTTAKPAHADLSMSEVQSAVTSGMNSAQITDSNAGILGTLESLIRVSVSLVIPTTPMALIRCLFDGLRFSWAFNACSAFKSAFSLQDAETLPATMEDLWDVTRPETVRRPMNERIVLQHTAAYEQVMESQIVASQAATGQGALALEDETTLQAINAAAGSGELLAVLALQSQLIAGTNARLSALVMQGNAAQQTRGAALMAETYKPALAVAYRGTSSPEVGGANQL